MTWPGSVNFEDPLLGFRRFWVFIFPFSKAGSFWVPALGPTDLSARRSEDGRLFGFFPKHSGGCRSGPLGARSLQLKVVMSPKKPAKMVGGPCLTFFGQGPW